jgi:endonuclease/exonuclease/phosphatase family metal-dependent hydrolase
MRSRNYDRLCARLSLSDAFPRDVESSASFTVHRENPYVAASSFAKGPSECLDYVLLSANMRSRGAMVVLKEPDGDLGRPLSDHYGVLASLELGSAAASDVSIVGRAGGVSAADPARAHLERPQCE